MEGSAAVLILRYYPGIHLEGLRKTTKTLGQDSCLLGEIWTQELPNMKYKW
jgi:hypothetical protein